MKNDDKIKEIIQVIIIEGQYLVLQQWSEEK